MAKTTFADSVIITSSFLNGAQEIFFDGQNEDWHFAPIDTDDIDIGNFSDKFVTLDTDQTIGAKKIFHNGTGPIPNVPPGEEDKFQFAQPVVGVDPTDPVHLATRQYVDNAVGGVSFPNLVNVGSGSEVYKEFVSNEIRLRTVSSGSFINVQTSANEIVVNLDTLNLDDISDVNLTSPSTNQVLIRNSSNQWVNSDISAITATSLELDDLSDVNTSGASTGEVLTRQGSNWVSSPISSVAGTNLALNDLSDVSVSGATDFQILTKSGPNWIPSTLQNIVTNVTFVLQDLDNVNNPGSNSGVFLFWDFGAGLWKPSNAPSTGDIPQWNGTTWTMTGSSLIGGVTVRQAGSTILSSNTLNFIGATVTNNSGIANITIDSAVGSVQQGGTPVVTNATSINFVSGATVTNNSGTADVVIDPSWNSIVDNPFSNTTLLSHRDALLWNDITEEFELLHTSIPLGGTSDNITVDPVAGVDSENSGPYKTLAWALRKIYSINYLPTLANISWEIQLLGPAINSVNGGIGLMGGIFLNSPPGASKISLIGESGLTSISSVIGIELGIQSTTVRFENLILDPGSAPPLFFIENSVVEIIDCTLINYRMIVKNSDVRVRSCSFSQTLNNLGPQDYRENPSSLFSLFGSSTLQFLGVNFLTNTWDGTSQPEDFSADRQGAFVSLYDSSQLYVNGTLTKNRSGSAFTYGFTASRRSSIISSTAGSAPDNITGDFNNYDSTATLDVIAVP
jgi:hypothetical protein